MINRAPLAFVAIFFMAGIALANAFPLLSDYSREIVVHVLACAIAIVLASLLYYFYRCTQRYIYFSTLILTAGLFVLAFATGILHELSRNDFPDHHVAYFPGIEEEVIFLGETRAHGTSANGRQRFILEARRLYTDGKSILVTGRMLVTLDSTLTLPPPGHVVLVRGRFLSPPGRCNPGEFAYDAYLKRLGILRVMTVNQMRLVKPARGTAALVRRQVYHFQQKVRGAMNQFIAGDESRAILQALILGDQSTLTKATRLSFQQTGLSHVLAVSGLHVMLVGMLVYKLLGPMCLRMGFSWRTATWSRTAITLLILCLYMLITGARASVCRAVLVSLLMIGGALFQRPASSFNALGAAALLLLFYRPAYLFDVGFQLSFLAVLGILSLMPVFSALLPRRLPGFVNSLLQSVLVSISATLGTIPVLLYHFGYLSFAGIILNIPALPLVAISLLSGLLTLLTATIFPGLAGLFGSAADFFVNTLLTIVSKGSAHLSALSISPGNVSLQTATVLFLICLTILTLSLRRFRWKLLITLLSCLMLGQWIDIATATHQPRLSLLFFDVGHGDASLITFPNGRRLLVDTGNVNQFTNQTQHTILPYLQRNGIKSLNVVLITHPHRDHAGGLPTLLASIPVHRIIHGPVDGEVIKENYTTPTRIQRSSFTPVVAGDTLLIDPSVSVRILSPGRQLAHADNLNERSIILQMEYGQTSFLLLGDAEAGAENGVILNYPELPQPDVIKVGHHGSATSSIEPLVDWLIRSAIPKSVALVSVGSNSRYGLPDEEVIIRWNSAGADVHVTAVTGALQIQSDGLTVWKTWSGDGCKG